jgi:hypothetical protein
MPQYNWNIVETGVRTNRQDITEILLKVALKTITPQIRTILMSDLCLNKTWFVKGYRQFQQYFSYIVAFPTIFQLYLGGWFLFENKLIIKINQVSQLRENFCETKFNMISLYIFRVIWSTGKYRDKYGIILQLNSFYIKFDSKHFFYLYYKYYN